MAKTKMKKINFLINKKMKIHKVLKVIIPTLLQITLIKIHNFQTKIYRKGNNLTEIILLKINNRYKTFNKYENLKIKINY